MSDSDGMSRDKDDAGTAPSVRAPRVAVVTRLFAPEVGAAAFRLKSLADGLVEQGANVTVVTTTLPPGSPVFKPRYKLRRWPVLRDAGGYVRGYVQYLSFDIPAFFRLLAMRADVVVAEPPPTTGVAVALSSIIRRRPFVYYAADIWSEALSAMDVPAVVKSTMRAVEGAVMRRAAAVIAVSEAVGEKVARFGVEPANIHVAGNGIDTHIFSLGGRRESNTAPYFVYTGTMSEWQGAGVFIEALALLQESHPGTELRFFGQGTDEPALRALGESVAPGRVHFGGVVPPEDAAAWLRGAAGALVSIKPGQGYDFAKPTKIYAAAGCGTAVLFTGVGEGAAVVAENHLGMAADYDAAEVAAAMIALLDAPADESGRKARSDWVINNASLQAAGLTAARAVLRAGPAG